MILKQVSEVLEELKQLKIFIKYGKDLKIFQARYNTYRDKLFYEGNLHAWNYMNDGTFKSESDTIRELVFSNDNLKELCILMSSKRQRFLWNSSSKDANFLNTSFSLCVILKKMKVEVRLKNNSMLCSRSLITIWRIIKN